MKSYKIRMTAANDFAIYEVTAYRETRVAVRKTREAAEKWVRKHS